jgi:hypothetical protein
LEYLDEYTSKEEMRLEVLGNRKLKTIIELKEKELRGGWRN